MIYVYIENKLFAKQILYTFETVFNILHLRFSLLENEVEAVPVKCKIVVIYAEKVPEFIHIIGIPYIFIKDSLNFFTLSYLKEFNPKKLFIRREIFANDLDVVSIFCTDQKLFVDIDQCSIKTNIDFISDCFFILSRYEEYMESQLKLDLHGRFPAQRSVASESMIINRPIVNEFSEILCGWIEKLCSDLFIKGHLDSRKPTAFITHDIDYVREFTSVADALKHAVKAILYEKSMKAVFGILKRYCASRVSFKKDPYWSFKYIMDCEDKYGFKSTFFFITDQGGMYGADYSLSESKIKSLIDILNYNGYEVGLHGSYNSALIPDKLTNEKKLLSQIQGKEHFGVRQHYLRFKIPFTWREQKKAELVYDCSLGFAERTGFRCGICTPFKPFDLEKNEQIEIWEIPLVVMDRTLINEQYMGLSKEEAVEEIISYISIIKKHKGVFCILWHNNTLSESCKKWRLVFEKTLQLLYQNNFTGLSGEEIIKQWVGEMKI